MRIAALAAVVAGLVLWVSRDAESPPAPILIKHGDKTVASVSPVDLESVRGRQKAMSRVPSRRTQVKGRATIKLRTDRSALSSALARAARNPGQVVNVPERAIASRINIPVVRQIYRNNCETAALSMLLGAQGKRVGQADLQSSLRTSGPLDPKPSDSGELTWGNPSKGFVGRPDGGGTHGGYGVYEPPIIDLAKEKGLRLESLTRTSPSRIYNRVLTGVPVMVWVGLSDGPYLTWRTPSGVPMTGNFGEHTVVLTAVRGEKIRVNDPLVGKRVWWSKSDFELKWQRLGTRAVAPHPRPAT